MGEQKSCQIYVLIGSVLLLAGCCGPFKSFQSTADYSRLGKNGMEIRDVYQACHQQNQGALQNTRQQLEASYQTLLPEACAKDPGFTALDRLPTELLRRYDSDSKEVRAVLLAQAQKAGKEDCKTLKQDKTLPYVKRLTEFEYYVSDRAAPYNKKLTSSSDLLCAADQSCRVLLDTYTSKMHQCFYQDYDVATYKTGYSTWCTPLLPMGGGGGSNHRFVESKNPIRQRDGK